MVMMMIFDSCTSNGRNYNSSELVVIAFVLMMMTIFFSVGINEDSARGGVCKNTDKVVMVSF